MAKRKRKKKAPKEVEALTHEEAKRKNIPTAEYQSLMGDGELSPIEVEIALRDRDLDPQLVWRGKHDKGDTLTVQAPPLFIQEKVHPKVLIDDLIHRSDERRDEEHEDQQFDLFADFNGIFEEARKAEFYQHDATWTNRLILGDSLQVMASLADREGLRGKVQCIYIDPPYGIKFNSNFQWSTTSRDVKDGKGDHITREPEQVKAFRDTWRNGIHSYLSYLRERISAARELLTESGSLFIQIGKENQHLVQSVMAEVFGSENFVSLITFAKTTGQTDNLLASVSDYILWFARDRKVVKYRQLLRDKELGGEGGSAYNRVRSANGSSRSLSAEERLDSSSLRSDDRIYRIDNLTSQSPGTRYPVAWQGREFYPKGYWKTQESSMHRLLRADRVESTTRNLYYVRFFHDYSSFPLTDSWTDTTVAGFAAEKRYVVETSAKVVERCIQMASDAGDLVLDPTCGSGTTAYVAEQWGRRWIMIDTSRVALALARARIMGARYPYYLLADSEEGREKEAEITGSVPKEGPVSEDVSQGFVYERVSHITLGGIANNAEIDVIWETYQETLEPLREELNSELGESWEEWEIPREAGEGWSKEAKKLHEEWWKQRIARQKEIDASIAAKADFEYLYDKPYEDRSKVRVAGPFTVESLSPHRTPGVDEDGELIDSVADGKLGIQRAPDFPSMILDNLKTSGVQQAHKEDRIDFSSVTAWPGHFVAAEGIFTEGEGEDEKERRAAIMIGPEFGTVSRPDLVDAAREAADGGFDLLICCAFSYAASATDLQNVGKIQVLKARMNADLHMAEDLKNTGKGNLFVIFGEPDIDIIDADDDQIRVKINGVDVFDPRTGEVRSDDTDGIACWFIDTEYNAESFFVRHAYFLGANDPYKSLKRTLKAEIDEEAWETLHSDVSRPFDKPSTGRIAVKVINHLGDEVMKVFRV